MYVGDWAPSATCKTVDVVAAPSPTFAVVLCIGVPFAGGGLVFWHPRGARVRHVIETFWKDLHLARGYELVYSPHIAKVRTQ